MTKEREAVARAISGAPFASKASLRKANAAIAAMKPLLMDVTPEMVEAGTEASLMSLGGDHWTRVYLAMIRHHPLFKEPANNG